MLKELLSDYSGTGFFLLIYKFIFAFYSCRFASVHSEMGNETSRRCGTADYLAPHLLNNVNPLKFHSVHGENIHLSKNDTIATREGGFCKAIAFSHRPVAVNEYIYIKFLDVQTCWSGSLRIGFTANDPVTYRNKLPKYSCPCMTEMPGNWARALTERYAVTNSVLFYYVDSNGDVHYGFNDEEKGIFFGGVETNTQLWALVDIYGNTVKIELLDPRSRNSRGETQRDTSESSTLNLSSTGHESQNYLNLSEVVFHRTHGPDVRIERNKASAINGYNRGYIFVEKRITANECIVFRIMGCSTSVPDSIVFGLTSCSPAVLSHDDFPDDPEDLADRPEYWVSCKCLQNIQPADILAFVVERDGAVQYSVNGERVKLIFYVDISAGLWFFMNIGGSGLQIKLEGIYQKSQHENMVTLMTALRSHHELALRRLQLNEEEMSDMAQVSNANECVICCENVANCALYRCGHVCMCYRCAIQVKERDSQCPICRGIILDVLQIFT